MTCADFEVLLCDYLDGTLEPAQRRAIEEHQRQCAACAEFARDVQGAVAFLGSVPALDPPPELLTKITFGIPEGGQQKKGWRSWFGGRLQPVLQPRFAMGMAMTILSFSMLGRVLGIEAQQLRPADLQPAKVWAAADDRIHRTWDRAVKYYENLRLVYEVQTRLREWTEQEESGKGEQPAPAAKQEEPRAMEGKERK